MAANPLNAGRVPGLIGQLEALRTLCQRPEPKGTLMMSKSSRSLRSPLPPRSPLHRLKPLYSPPSSPAETSPAHLRPVAPVPKGGDIPSQFNAPRGEFQYVRREIRIPMRDGAKLYAVLIIPRMRASSRSCSTARLIRRTRRPRRGGFGPLPENILSPLTPSWSAPATSSRSRMCAASTSPTAITS